MVDPVPADCVNVWYIARWRACLLDYLEYQMTCAKDLERVMTNLIWLYSHRIELLLAWSACLALLKDAMNIDGFSVEMSLGIRDKGCCITCGWRSIFRTIIRTSDHCKLVLEGLDIWSR